MQKMKCTCLRMLKASIGAITIFKGSSGSSSVCCRDSTSGQRVSGVLAQRQYQTGVALLTLRTPSDRLSSPCIWPNCCQIFLCENDDVDGSSKRRQSPALDYFLHTLIKVHHRHTSERIYLKNFPECYSRSWDYAMWKWDGWDKKLIFIQDF